jgi:hypothetical protein
MNTETPSPTLSTLLNTFEQFIQDLQDQGLRTVPCSGPLPSVSPAAPSVAAQVPARNTPPAVTAEPTAPSAPVRTPEPPMRKEAPDFPPAPEEKDLSGLVMLLLERLPECLEGRPPEDTRILLVVESGELSEPQNRELLQSMLYAIGYPLPAAQRPVSELRECTSPVQRIVCMGEAANDHLCTVKMGLSLVRGKWQDTPAGRMIATFPPSYLQDNPTGKRAAWGDLQKLLKDLGLSMPEWTRKKLGK